MHPRYVPENAAARNDVAQLNGPYFGLIPRWVGRLRLTGLQQDVLREIACYKQKGTWITFAISIETIADELKIHRRTVQRIIRQLEEKGVLETLPGGGRGRANQYEILFEQAANAKKSGNEDAAVSATVSAALSGKTAAIPDQNSGALDAAPTESKQKERTPPNGGVARAREEGEALSNDGGYEKQGVLLLPIDGGGDRQRRLAVIKRYNPSPALVERAAELGINALAEDVFGKWQRHRIATNRLPLDLEAAEADLENWIRDEARFPERDATRSRKNRNTSTLAEDQAAAACWEKLRAYRAQGGVYG